MASGTAPHACIDSEKPTKQSRRPSAASIGTATVLKDAAASRRTRENYITWKEIQETGQEGKRCSKITSMYLLTCVVD